MPLKYGCTKNAETLFGKKFNLRMNPAGDGTAVHITLPSEDWFSLHCMYGDCTSAILYNEFLSENTLEEGFKTALRYLSISGRISCFFSRKVDKSNLENTVAILRKFPIVGLHVQKSNRDRSDAYMVSGILKVPSPHICQSYDKYYGDFDEKHNMLDSEKFNEINKQLGLETLNF